MHIVKARAVAAIAFLAAALFLIAPATADPRPTPQSASVAKAERNLTGCYIGLQIGGSVASTEVSVGIFGIDGLASHGVTGGVYGGCDWQPAGKQFLVGLTGGYNWGKTDFDVNPGLFSATIGTSWSGGVRVGAVVAGTLLYVPAGYTRADFEWSIPVPAPDLKGWYTGAGFEVPLTDMLTMGAEYRFTHYQRETIGGFLNLDTDQHSLVGRVTLHTPDLFGAFK